MPKRFSEGSRAFLLGSGVLHIMQVVAIFILFNEYHFVDPALYESVKSAESRDVLNVATQLGRFDLVSMFLAVVTLFLGVIALAGFWTIRGAALRAAEAAAREEVKNSAEKYVKQWMDAYGRDSLRAVEQVARGATEAEIEIGPLQERSVIENASELKEE